MDLTLNELKIIRNALYRELRTASIQSEVFIDIEKSLIKIMNEMARIESEVKQKTCDEALKSINQMFRTILPKNENNKRNIRNCRKNNYRN